MNTFPLIRVKWSNEHIMAALFFVLVLYHIPQWKDNPAAILNFLILIAVGFFIDVVANLIRYKRLWCSVSAGITAAIISLLTSGVPIWGQLLGVVAALVLGKHFWGGTGKNRINPAMVGLFVILLFWNIPYPFFPASYLLLPAIILSLPFLKFRPYASIGFLLGLVVILAVNRDLSLDSLISNGVFFWSCVVLTDPVTVTKNPWSGSVIGFLSGLAVMYFLPDPLMYVAGILLINLLSFMSDSVYDKSAHPMKPNIRIPKAFAYSEEIVDLSGENNKIEEAELGISEMSAEDIINNLKFSEVFGMGGAAFPTFQKLLTVREAKRNKKYLIINGIECDPGLLHDHYILLHYPEEIRKGIEILLRCAEFSSVHIAVKNSEGVALSEGIQVHKVQDKYPIGAEKILIKEILNLQLGADQIPADYGILVLNVQTVYSIYRAIYLNKPANTRFLTVANLKDKTAKVVNVRLGMKLGEVFEAVYPGFNNIYAGGGIMQAYSAEEDAVVDKSVNFIAAGAFPKYKESPQCSQCGSCISNCPAGLQVKKIADLVDQGKMKETEKYYAKDCIGCGSCSYSCRAGRNLASKVKIAKDALKDTNQKSK